MNRYIYILKNLNCYLDKKVAGLEFLIVIFYTLWQQGLVVTLKKTLFAKS